MTYIFDSNYSTIEGALIDVSTNMPVLFPTLLFLEFMFILGIGVMSSKKFTGFSNFPMWCSIAGLSTTMSAMFLTSVEGIIPVSILIMCLAVTCGSVLWFFMSERD